MRLVECLIGPSLMTTETLSERAPADADAALSPEAFLT